MSQTEIIKKAEYLQELEGFMEEIRTEAETIRDSIKAEMMAQGVEEMEAGEWDFTMFTCTIGGSNRVTVRCEATGEISETGSEPDVIKAAEESKHIRKQN